MPPDHDALARSLQDGDPDALGGLVDLYQERFYRVAYRVVGDPDEALDVVQEAFVKIDANIAGWDGNGFTSWAYRVVTNLAIDCLRRRGRERKACEGRALRSPGADEDRSADGLVGEERAGLLAQVRAAIQALPPGQRAIVALRHYEGFTLQEIADVRGCALGTVKSTLHQAFRSLRRALGQGSPTAAGSEP